MKFLVIPSNRADCLRSFLAAWGGVGDWDRVVVVEDGPARTFELPGDGRHFHYSWREIDGTLGDESWIISRRDSAIRCFGFLMACRLGATHILTLDDDCYPRPGDPPIFQAHLSSLGGHRRWVPSVPGMRTRGLPYRNLGAMPGVVASMGLWSGVPDLDAPQSLADLDFATNGRYEPPSGTRLIPRGQYAPLCGMNLCFEASVAPLFYFPLMGQSSPYRRMDDIWAGVLFKAMADHLGLSLSVGEPFVRHSRASDVMANLVKEAPGIATNEWLWEAIDTVPLSAATPTGVAAELGGVLESHPDGYVARLGRALQVWAQFFGG